MGPNIDAILLFIYIMYNLFIQYSFKNLIKKNNIKLAKT